MLTSICHFPSTQGTATSVENNWECGGIFWLAQWEEGLQPAISAWRSGMPMRGWVPCKGEWCHPQWQVKEPCSRRHDIKGSSSRSSFCASWSGSQWLKCPFADSKNHTMPEVLTKSLWLQSPAPDQALSSTSQSKERGRRMTLTHHWLLWPPARVGNHWRIVVAPLRGIQEGVTGKWKSQVL